MCPLLQGTHNLSLVRFDNCALTQSHAADGQSTWWRLVNCMCTGGGLYLLSGKNQLCSSLSAERGLTGHIPCGDPGSYTCWIATKKYCSCGRESFKTRWSCFLLERILLEPGLNDLLQREATWISADEDAWPSWRLAVELTHIFLYRSVPTEA